MSTCPSLLSPLPPPRPSHSFRWSHSTTLGSPCHPANSHWLSIPHMVMNVFPGHSLKSILLIAYTAFGSPKTYSCRLFPLQAPNSGHLASVEVLTESSKSYESVPLNVSDGPHTSPQAWGRHGFGCHLHGPQKSTRHSNFPPGPYWSCQMGTSRVFSHRGSPYKEVDGSCLYQPGTLGGTPDACISVTNIIVFTNCEFWGKC